MKKTYIPVLIFMAVLIGLFNITPREANAGGIDLCLFLCNDSPSRTVTNSYNTNTTSGANSPIVTSVVDPLPGHSGSVYMMPAATTQTPAIVVNSSPAQTPVYNSPVYNIAPTYSYAPTPVYSYNYDAYQGYIYHPTPTYNYIQPQYPPITVSCSVNTTFTPAGSYVTWSAYPSGGYSGYGYSYSWSGTDGLYGNQSTLTKYYYTPGVKYAYVTVNSGNGQTASAQCSNSVTVGVPTATYQTSSSYNYNNQYFYNSGIQIACLSDRTSAVVGTPITWNAEATGSGYMSGFTYAWTGTDGLSSNQSSAITTYVTPGTKSAIVTVTAPNGQSQSKACLNTVSVRNTASVAPTTVVKPPAVVAPVDSNSAAALFSLQNVPWGWVAILVILILLGMIMYLVFNKKKI